MKVINVHVNPISAIAFCYKRVMDLLMIGILRDPIIASGGLILFVR